MKVSSGLIAPVTPTVPLGKLAVVRDSKAVRLLSPYSRHTSGRILSGSVSN